MATHQVIPGVIWPLRHGDRLLQTQVRNARDEFVEQRGTGDAIRHPHGNRGRLLVVLAQPELATLPHAALNENRLAVQRMPRIVDRDLLSVVGGM